jgi:DnaK suppressor protein
MVATKGKERIKEMLEGERIRLHGEVERLGINEEENLGYGNHMADDASEVFEQAKNLALRQALLRQMEQIDAALERLEKGVYGYCTECGDKIDMARLEVMPSASLCIACMQRRESGR